MRKLLSQIVYLLFVLLAVTFLVSAMMELLPGDAAAALLGEDATPAEVDALREKLNLDESFFPRYVDWLVSGFGGDLGESLRTGEDVLDQVQFRLPVTLELVILAQSLALLYAVPAAVYSAYRPGGLLDRATTASSSVLLSTPTFVLGLLFILLFAVRLGWAPVAGYTRWSDSIGENLRSVALPVIALASHPAATYQRVLRADMGNTLSDNFISMAELKGLSKSRVLFGHALRPSLFSLVTVFGITTATMLGGSVIVEFVFGLPGMGRLLIDSIAVRDLVVVQGLVVVIGAGYVIMNVLSDILYTILDPRVRREH